MCRSLLFGTLSLSIIFTPFLAEAGLKAKATLNPTKGNNVQGVVTFEEVEGGTLVKAAVTGLTQGEHGFHIHEKGDCSSGDGLSAGGHFNPEGHPHAGPDAEKRHMGDLGNLVADERGVANYERIDTHINLQGDMTIVGRSVIIHKDKDDFTSQPTGNAGDRLACGFIALEKE